MLASEILARQMRLPRAVTVQTMRAVDIEVLRDSAHPSRLVLPLA